MKIAKDRVVAIEYTIRNQAGDVVDTSDGRGPLVYLHGHDQIVPGVESAIDGLEAGKDIEVSIDPGDAYGERDPGAILILPRSAFPAGEDLEAGTMFRAFRSDGRPVIFSVIEASEEHVVVDANHPLAGQTLKVNVIVLSVRTATGDELRHGHVHSDAGASSDQLA
jgi:FKBP-type peptidyl-prolyl cis-trans isomerase SlyD